MFVFFRLIQRYMYDLAWRIIFYKSIISYVILFLLVLVKMNIPLLSETTWSLKIAFQNKKSRHLWRHWLADESSCIPEWTSITCDSSLLQVMNVWYIKSLLFCWFCGSKSKLRQIFYMCFISQKYLINVFILNCDKCFIHEYC